MSTTATPNATATQADPLLIPQALTSLPDGVRASVDVVGDDACPSLVGRLLAAMTASRQPRAIVEVGSANGLSAAWMASAVGRTVITTIEPDAQQSERARLVHDSAGLAGTVRLLHGADAEELLDRLSDAQYELCVVQTAPTTGVLAEIRRLLEPGGTIIVRNADAWLTASSELSQLLDAPGQTVSHLPIDGGLIIATLR